MKAHEFGMIEDVLNVSATRGDCEFCMIAFLYPEGNVYGIEARRYTDLYDNFLRRSGNGYVYLNEYLA